MESLYQSLVKYSKEGYYPMHMPGHKRNTEIINMLNPYQIDITEIYGFDNLHDANEILKDAMDRAARIYHSEHTHFLINGSTVGILSAINSVTHKGDTVIVARNCHKAVYHAIYLGQLNPVYIYPQLEQEFEINGGISPEKIEKLLIEHPETKLIIVTSPTYEGILSDIEAIANISHGYHIPLMVDEAHGAHLGFSKHFPQTSISKGADIVIHSVHKTLPSITQTALLHVNGNLVDNNKVKKMLSIYESSSPSYVLMSSIDLCMELLESQGDELFEIYQNRLQNFYHELNLKNLRILNNTVLTKSDIYGLDPSKIVISTKYSTIDGKALYDTLLHKYKIQLEMVSKDYVIAMTSICDTEEGFLRLQHALIEIDQAIEHGLTENNDMNNTIQDKFKISDNIFETENVIRNSFHKQSQAIYENVPLNIKYNIYEASEKQTEDIMLEEGSGRISADYIYLYPPGIPLIVPGEEITGILIEKLIEYKKRKLDIKGLRGLEKDTITVLKNG